MILRLVTRRFVAANGSASKYCKAGVSPPSSSHRWFSTTLANEQTTTASTSLINPLQVRFNQRTNLIFGANTDVGKTIIAAGLSRAGLAINNDAIRTAVHYVKPMQCGGWDEDFIQRYSKPATTNNSSQPHQQQLSTRVLFSWDTSASPHFASRIERQPCSDEELLRALHSDIYAAATASESSTSDSSYLRILIETAGGVLSPAASSPHNQSPRHARTRTATTSKNKSDKDGADSTSSWGWTPQADLFQPLLGQCPVILVGDGRLGGISATLSSLESLLVRGYTVAAVVVVDSPDSAVGHNAEAIREYASGRPLKLRSGAGQALFASPQKSIVSLPPIPKDPMEPLDDWYNMDQVTESFAKLDVFLQATWEEQVDDLLGLRSKGRDVIWWPFTQHGNVTSDDKVTLIDSASGDYYNVLTPFPAAASSNPPDSDTTEKASATTPATTTSTVLERHGLFDACASWWTQGVGHGDSSMALASAAAAGRYGHVIFPDVVHAPAVALSEQLLGPSGPGHEWANRAFFTDNGSTGMEVAVKMAFKTYEKRVGAEEANKYFLDCVAQADSYHGDTLGVMNLSEPSIFNEGQHPWYEPRGLFLRPPTLAFKDGRLSVTLDDGNELPDDVVTEFDSIKEAMDVEARLMRPKMMSVYKEFIDIEWTVYEHKEIHSKIGCAVIEPILMGAGGMKFVDPLWQRALIDVAKSKKVPVVFDEVASGLHRVGVTSCREIIGMNPDIACYAKLLTGGLLPLSVTLASNEVFETFLGDEKSQALLHGHSYSANPIGCVAALHALEAYDNVVGKRRPIQGPRMLFDEAQVRELSLLPAVEQSFTLGTVLAVTIQPEEGSVSGYGSSSRAVPVAQELRKHGVYVRPLGNVIYVMVSPLTSQEECTRLTDKLFKVLQSLPAGMANSKSAGLP